MADGLQPHSVRTLQADAPVTLKFVVDPTSNSNDFALNRGCGPSERKQQFQAIRGQCDQFIPVAQDVWVLRRDPQH